jgi:hypothetical protein
LVRVLRMSLNGAVAGHVRAGSMKIKVIKPSHGRALPLLLLLHLQHSLTPTLSSLLLSRYLGIACRVVGYNITPPFSSQYPLLDRSSLIKNVPVATSTNNHNSIALPSFLHRSCTNIYIFALLLCSAFASLCTYRLFSDSLLH